MRSRALRRGLRLTGVRAVAVALLAALPALAACSGEGAPTDASQEEFCSAYNLLADASNGADFRRLAEQLRATGTPADISEDGRAGFDVVVRVAGGLDEDASLEELEDPNVSSQEVRQAREFLDYGATTCGAPGGGGAGL